MIRTRVLEKGTKKKEQIEVQEKVLMIWSEKYAKREKIRREGALAYANKLTDAELFRKTCKKGGKKYLKLYRKDEESQEEIAYSPFISIDESEVAFDAQFDGMFDAQFDGMNVLVTSELTMSDEEILSQYRELSKIEDCFKVTKTEFRARPVYASKREHIAAHFLTCFLSLMMLRILQHVTKWEFSPQRLVVALNSATANELTNGYYRVQANDDLKQIHTQLGIILEYNFVKHEELKKYGKDWCTTFFSLFLLIKSGKA